MDLKVEEEGSSSDLAPEIVAESRMHGDQGEEQALLFLNSFDSYLLLLDSLSSVLHQGWLELASARHSMGSSRVSSTLLDLKIHSAATTVLMSKLVKASQPQFKLLKWTSLEERKSSPKEVIDGRMLADDNCSGLRHRASKQVLEGTRTSSESSSSAVDENVRAGLLSPPMKQRYKSLSVFGVFVTPKLRASQVSFETALDIIVEIANIRSSMLFSFCQLQQQKSNKKC